MDHNLPLALYSKTPKNSSAQIIYNYTSYLVSSKSFLSIKQGI